MRKTVWWMLLALGVVAATAWAQPPAKAVSVLYVSNLLTGGQVATVDCGDANLTVPAGQVRDCRLTDGTQIAVAIDGGAAVALEVTPERAFTLALPGGATLRGTTETLMLLVPDRTAYFLYLWHVGAPR